MRKKLILIVCLVLFIAIAAFVISRVVYVEKAHQTFDNYYAFRGCTQLLTRTDDSATCTTSGGQTIKIIKYKDNKWYLDGDLPACWKNWCF